VFSNRLPEKNRRSAPQKNWFIRCLILFLTITGAIILLLIAGASVIGTTPMLGKVIALTTSIRPWLYSGQLSLIAVLWWKWSSFISWLAKRGTITEQMCGPLLASRHRIISAILAIQIFVVMGIPFRNPFSVY